MNRSSNNRKASVRAEKIRVLIADDHITFLAGLTSIIDMEQDMIVVAQATDGRQASRLLTSVMIDLLTHKNNT